MKKWEEKKKRKKPNPKQNPPKPKLSIYYQQAFSLSVELIKYLHKVRIKRRNLKDHKATHLHHNIMIEGLTGQKMKMDVFQI